ncbi:MAG: hypothetical protein JWM05_2242 [Acidimicrobiales bacterium]|nr:hypothetical protein [Acidimicrobiales bacterium]
MSAPDHPPIPAAALLGLVAIDLVVTVGLAGDILRHVQNQALNGQDFLSGWHLVLYGGVLGVGAWLGLAALRLGPQVVWGEARFATAGFLTLSFGGLADSAWHAAYGSEASIEALVSPPHLVVFVGLSLLLLAPVWALWQRAQVRLGPVESACVALSIVSALLVASLFTGFLSPLTGGMDLGGGYFDPMVGTSLSEFDLVRGLGVVLWTTVLLTVPWSMVLDRFRLFPGFALVSIAVLGIPPVVVNGSSARSMLFAFAAYGVVIELASMVLRRRGDRRAATWQRVLIGAAAPAALWATNILVISLDGLLSWSQAQWGGAITLAAIWGAVAAAVATRQGATRAPSGAS